MNDQTPAWRWVIFIAFFVLCPILFKPWWLTVVAIAIFCFFAAMLYPGNSNSK
jgi:hypothetical protein